MSYDPYPGGGPGGYQPFPGGAAAPPPVQRQPEPPSVVNAVRLMFTGAGLTAISVIIGLATVGSLKSTLTSNYPNLTASQVNTAANLAIVGVIVGGLIGIGLWIWMAFMCRAGKNWARITGTVFFGLDTLGLLNLARPNLAVSKIFTVIVWLVGLGAVILLWRRESSAYFKQQQYPY